MLWVAILSFVLAVIVVVSLSVTLAHMSRTHKIKGTGIEADHADLKMAQTFLPRLEARVHAIAACEDALIVVCDSSDCVVVRGYRFTQTQHVRETGSAHRLFLGSPVGSGKNLRATLNAEFTVVWQPLNLWVFRTSETGLQLALKCEPKESEFLSVHVFHKTLIVQYANGKLCSAAIESRELIPVPAKMPHNTARLPIVNFLDSGRFAVLRFPGPLAVWDLASGKTHVLKSTHPQTVVACVADTVFYLVESKLVSYKPNGESTPIELPCGNEVILNLKVLAPFHVLAHTNLNTVYCLDARTFSTALVVRDVALDSLAMVNGNGDVLFGRLNSIDSNPSDCFLSALKGVARVTKGRRVRTALKEPQPLPLHGVQTNENARQDQKGDHQRDGPLVPVGPPLVGLCRDR